MKRAIIFLILVFLSPFCGYADDLTVAGAANVQFPLEELKREFEKDTPIKLELIIGSSGKLAAQIENGAPFDIFLSADMEYPQAIYKKNLSYEKPRIYAYGTLVLWSFKNIDLSKGIKILADDSIKKIALPNPKTAPYGREAMKVLKKYHLYQAVQKNLVFGESIAQSNQFISSQAADIGFTAKSAVLAQNSQGKGRWIEIDPQLYNPIAQGVVILKYAEKHNQKAARQFYDFLFSAKAQAILKKYGYTLLP